MPSRFLARRRAQRASLFAAVSTAGVVLAAACSPATTSTAAQPAAARLNDIQHIVIVYMENWSFDSLYGNFPGVGCRGVQTESMPVSARPTPHQRWHYPCGVRVRSIAVLGGGIAGLSAALLLARDGHRVTLIERDDLYAGDALDSPGWNRKGIPHFLQPHAFIPRGRAELQTLLPDIYDELLAAGAHDVDVRRKLPGPPLASDVELQYLAVRRPLIEWALRRAVRAEPAIECHAQTRVSGVDVVHGRITAVRAGDFIMEVDLAVDALGRRSPAVGWLAAATGEPEAPPETSDCRVIYYSRYYRQRPGFDLPDGPWLLSPRGDLGYIGYASFPGDNGAFAGLLAVPTGVAEWQGFKNATVFEAAVAQIPALRAWIDPGGVDPITDVLPMAGLRNSIRRYEPRWVRGSSRSAMPAAIPTPYSPTDCRSGSFTLANSPGASGSTVTTATLSPRSGRPPSQRCASATTSRPRSMGSATACGWATRSIPHDTMAITRAVQHGRSRRCRDG